VKIFLDTARPEECDLYLSMGIIDGITTNPSLIAQSGLSLESVIKGFCERIDGPISVEVIATQTQAMITEAQEYIKYGDNIVIKLPLTHAGLEACHALSNDGIMTNVTLCFSPTQALLAAKAGATFISPFIGRLEDHGQNGLDLIQDIHEIYTLNDMETLILAASIRSAQHVVEAAKRGADIVTINTKVLEEMIFHPLTQQGLDRFLSDWKNYQHKKGI